MAYLERHTKELLHHSLSNGIVILAITALALMLDYGEHWAEEHGVSAWLVFGIGLLAKISFILDGVLFCTTAAMISVHFLRELFLHLFRR